MTTLLLFFWWTAAGLILYTYGVFPMVTFLRARWSRRPFRRAPITPPISLIIAAYNEAASIRAKMDNLMASDYPSDQLEVIIASDGSTDDTNAIVDRYASRGIKLLALQRQGKAAALNAAVRVARGEILVFSDANSLYARDALRALVSPFADRTVGGVAGNQRYLDTQGVGASNAGERSYWNLDRLLKQLQTESGSAISATGAIYAIRRSLFRTVPAGVTDDFVTSTSVIAQGYRLVYVAEAIADEPTAESSRAEFGRKVRIMTRGLRAVLTMRELLNPFRYGFYALQLFSHKVLRRLVVFPLLVLFLISPFLWQTGTLYQVAVVSQAVFCLCAVFGRLLEGTPAGQVKILALPYFFCLVNLAALLAALNIVRGHRIERWEPQRQSKLG